MGMSAPARHWPRHAGLVALGIVMALFAALALGCARAQGPVPSYSPRALPPLAAWTAGDPVFQAPAAAPDKIGINYHGMWDENDETTRTRMLDAYAAAGVKWVRMDMAWDTLQPNPPDSVNGGYDIDGGVAKVNQRLIEIADRGMKTVVVMYWPPNWSSGTDSKNGQPADNADYGKVLGWAANRWPDLVAAWEMWNEPDLDTFWHSQDVNQFAELLKAAYPVAKDMAPDATFIAGSPTYVGTEWYRDLYAAGAGDSWDGIATHPYMAPSHLSPDQPDDGTVWMMNNLRELTELMAANGQSTMPIWATEFGWSAHPNTGVEENWDRGVTAEQQAQYLLQAMDVLAQYPQVQAAFWYTDRDTNVNDIHEDSFGLLNRDLTPKPAFYALKCVASGICGPPQ